jgi:2-polyprenyl-3-methyl-5-hydroxy-6-metoxy-1,4-benzoquinol methylase
VNEMPNSCSQDVPVAVPLGVEFDSRDACVACSATELKTIWEGAFGDEPVRAFLAGSQYAEDVCAYLADEHFALVECSRCGMRFQRRVLSGPWLARLYGDWIDQRQIQRVEATRDDFEDARQLVKHILRIQRTVNRLVSPGARPKLMDFGCGGGRFLSLATVFGWDAFGIDHSVTRGQQSRELGIDIFSDLQAFEAAVAERMHVVTLFQVLEHVVAPLELLTTLGARMVSGGVLIVEVPNTAGIDCPRTLGQFNLVHPLEHINAFVPKTLGEMCRHAGFEPLRRIPAHVTARLGDVYKTEASRFVPRSTTSQYFQWIGA